MNKDRNILFLCGRPFGSVDKAFWESQIVDVDWAEVLFQAKQQGMTALLYGHLKQVDFLDSLPDEVRNTLHRFFVLNVAHNERLEKLLFEILDIFQSAKIDIIAIKGLVLAKELYGDTVWRTMDDLDFLVQPSEVLRARELLLANGFVDNMQFGSANLQKYIDAGWDFSLIHADSGLIVEIGNGISPRYMRFNILDLELFKNQHDVKLSGGKVKTLSVEAQFLLCCIHGAKHHWNRLIWLADLNALLNSRTDIDFALIEKLAHKMGMRRMVLISMSLVNICFDTVLPPTIKQALSQNKYAKRSAGWLTEKLYKCEAPTSWQYRRFYIMSLDRVLMRIKYLVDLIFSPTLNDWKAVKLPESLSLLYYVIRPFRIIYSWLGRRFKNK